MQGKRMQNFKKSRMAYVLVVAGWLLLSVWFKGVRTGTSSSYEWQEQVMRNLCFLFSQAWFMMPNTFGGGLGACGRGGRTWRAELSHQCRKIGSMALQRAGRGGVLGCCVCWGSGVASGVSGHKAAHTALGQQPGLLTPRHGAALSNGLLVNSCVWNGPWEVVVT